MRVRKYEPFMGVKELERFLSLEANERDNISSFAPMVNTREDEKGYFVEIDLPGVSKDDISVDVDKNHLMISGERKFKTEVNEDDYYKTESFFGKFQRRFALPESVDTDMIEAKNENGVLEVFIPKIAPKVAKKIEIK